MRAALSPPGAAFLDRDGTINTPAASGEYLQAPGELHLLPGAADAIRRLNDASVKVIVITNQRGVALERMSLADVEAIHRKMSDLLAAASRAHVDGYFICPHEIGTCSCRKPDVGLFHKAKDRWPEIDFRASAMVGDSPSDTSAGEILDMRTVRLGVDAPDLASAVDALLLKDSVDR